MCHTGGVGVFRRAYPHTWRGTGRGTTHPPETSGGGVEPPGQAGTGRQRQHPHRTARIDQMYGDDGVRWDGQSGHSAGNGWR
jgi:hypothetical protein